MANLPHTAKPRQLCAYIICSLLLSLLGCSHKDIEIGPPFSLNRAGAISAFLTQEVQTKGLDWWDERKKQDIQRQAQEQAEAKLQQHYD